jgi:hypothetical protein
MTNSKARSTLEQRRLNTAGAAAYLGIPASTLRKFRYEGRGPIYCKPAGRCVYDVADLDAFLESGRRIPSERASKERARHVAL